MSQSSKTCYVIMILNVSNAASMAFMQDKRDFLLLPVENSIQNIRRIHQTNLSDVDTLVESFRIELGERVLRLTMGDLKKMANLNDFGTDKTVQELNNTVKDTMKKVDEGLCTLSSLYACVVSYTYFISLVHWSSSVLSINNSLVLCSTNHHFTSLLFLTSILYLT
jgi:hypothetical protein